MFVGVRDKDEGRKAARKARQTGRQTDGVLCLFCSKSEQALLVRWGTAAPVPRLLRHRRPSVSWTPFSERRPSPKAQVCPVIKILLDPFFLC